LTMVVSTLMTKAASSSEVRISGLCLIAPPCDGGSVGVVGGEF
jgi:hypothetical protein